MDLSNDEKPCFLDLSFEMRVSFVASSFVNFTSLETISLFSITTRLELGVREILSSGFFNAKRPIKTLTYL